MDKITTAYEIGLKEALTDFGEAVAYLDVALEENDQDILLLVLHDIVEAHNFSSTNIKVEYTCL